MNPANGKEAKARAGRSIGAAMTLLLMAAAWSPGPLAQSYPAKAIRLIVPFPPGGPTDIVARVLAQKISEGLGQQMIVDNRAGAGGTIGAEAAAKSASDGYTLLFGTTGTLAGAPNLYAQLGYDPLKSFAPVSMVSIAPLVVVVHPSVPAATLREFIGIAKSRPGQLNAASAGNGTPPHVAVEMFKMLAGIQLLHVPYKGTATAVLALLAGDVQMYVDQYNGSLQQSVRAGKIKALAVTSPKRLAQLADVPTAAEAGLPGFEISGWTGLLAPQGTAAEVIRHLTGEVHKALAAKDLRNALTDQGVEPAGNSPQQFSAFIGEEITRWSRAIKASGAKVD